MKHFALFALILLVLSAPSHAAEINEKGAKHLKSLFEDMINYQKKVSELTQGGEFIYQGEVSVEPSGDFYAVTLPHASVLYPDGRRVEIGIVSINASPYDQEKQWKMAVAMPTPMMVLDKDGQVLMKINIGAQRAAGIWHEDMQHFIKLDARYENIVIDSEKEDFLVTIPNITALYDLQEEPGGTWSGPAQITLGGMKMDFGENSNMSVDQLKLHVNLLSYNPKAVKNYREKILAMIEAAQSPDDQAVSTGHKLGFYNMMLDLLGEIGDGFTAQYEFTNLNVTKPGLPGKDPDKFHIGKAFMGFDMTGFLKDQVTIATRIGFDDLSMSSDSDDYSDLSPSAVNFDTVIEDIPFKQIANLGKNTLQGSLEQPGISKLAGLGFVMKVPALLSQAGTTITINNNSFGNAIYNVLLNGKIRADISALNSATAALRATITGLDRIVELIAAKGDAAEADSDEATKFQQMAAKLQILQVMAKTEKDAAGNTLHILDFEMNPMGQMLVNGQDLKTMFNPDQATRRQKPGAEEAPAKEEEPGITEPAAGAGP